jgi:nicotinamide phosphoribosyltransferase
MTVENTDPKLFWLTNYLETLLVQVWYPSTVATQSFAMKKLLLEYLHETGDPLLIDFKLHDFGYRGVTCPEQAAIGAASHLVNFQGTDTIAGLELLGEYYDEFCAGFSIPASEHSTITSWGKEHEVDACRNMLTQYPEGYVACVSDSYDIFNCCENIWGGELRE